MNTIDKIRAEIERRIESCDATSKTPNQLLWAELGALIAFLDTLEEPVSEDLGEAAKQYVDGPDCSWVGTSALEQAFKAGAEWAREQMPMPEDTLIYKKGVEEGRRLEREDVLSLIESRLSQIIGDAQPKPILRAELCDLLVQVKTRNTITKDEAIYKVLHQRADCLLRLRAERPQDWKGYYEGKFDGYTQAMQLLTETLESICIELEEQEHNDRQE